MVALTFPDGARREYPRRHFRSRHRQGHFALARQAHRRDGARRRRRRPRRPRSRRTPRSSSFRPRGPARAGADPARLRACDGGGGAGAVARHAGHHRPGDRQRLLLRLPPQRAVHARRPAGHRKEDARDHRAATRPSPRRSGRATRPSACSPRRARAFKVELVDAIPPGEELKIYRQGDWFDLCRGPHMTSTGKIGNRLQAAEGGRRLLARRLPSNPMLTRIYGTAFAKQEELDAHLKQIEEAEKRDHRKLGREMDLFHFQEEAPGSVFWHPKGWTLFQALEQLHPPPPAGGRLSGGQLARSSWTRSCGSRPATCRPIPT